jgi:hypothetical protein
MWSPRSSGPSVASRVRQATRPRRSPDIRASDVCGGDAARSDPLAGHYLLVVVIRALRIRLTVRPCGYKVITS